MKKVYRNKYIVHFVTLLLLAIFLSGCSIFIGKPVITKETSLKKLRTTAYPDFSDYFQYDDLAESINQSLSYLRRIRR